MARDGITIVHHALHRHAHGFTPIHVDRWTLAKTRWRGAARDGREFGFELEHPLTHGDVVADGYVIEQQPEPVLVVHYHDAREAATLAWSIGNLHQPVQVAETELITADDPAVRNYFAQQSIAFTSDERVFQPLRAAAHHHHHHA